MPGLQVVLRQPLPNFPGRAPDHRILIVVLIGIAPENLDPQRTLLKRLDVVVRRVLHHVPQKSRTSFARSELETIEDFVELEERGFAGHFGPACRQRSDPAPTVSLL